MNTCPNVAHDFYRSTVLIILHYVDGGTIAVASSIRGRCTHCSSYPTHVGKYVGRPRETLASISFPTVHSTCIGTEQAVLVVTTIEAREAVHQFLHAEGRTCALF